MHWVSLCSLDSTTTDGININYNVLELRGFFGGIRIPATFLAGSSLAAIFTLKSAANSLSNDLQLSKLERRVIKFYHLVSLLAFLLSLNTIVLATSAHTAVLHGRFDQMAETAYLMMKREFEYEASVFCI
jgi:hypothetical protein